jgi:hypothetical protein
MNEVIQVLNRWRPNDKAMQRFIINEILKSLGNITDFYLVEQNIGKSIIDTLRALHAYNQYDAINSIRYVIIMASVLYSDTKVIDLARSLDWSPQNLLHKRSLWIKKGQEVTVLGIRDDELSHFGIVQSEWYREPEGQLVTVWYPQLRKREDVDVNRIRLREMITVPIVTVSDYKNHDTTYVQVYFEKFFGKDGWWETQQEHPGLRDRITELHNRSDGAPSQFKQYGTLYYMTSLLRKLLFERITWSFSCESHGKGAKNGIGGVIKCKIRERTLTNELVIKNAKEYADEIRKEFCSEEKEVQYSADKFRIKKWYIIEISLEDCEKQSLENFLHY